MRTLSTMSDGIRGLLMYLNMSPGVRSSRHNDLSRDDVPTWRILRPAFETPHDRGLDIRIPSPRLDIKPQRSQPVGSTRCGTPVDFRPMPRRRPQTARRRKACPATGSHRPRRRRRGPPARLDTWLRRKPRAAARLSAGR